MARLVYDRELTFGIVGTTIVIVRNAWEHLGRVRSLTFSASSNSPVRSGWDGYGMGQVDVEQVGETTLIFREWGAWLSAAGLRLNFRNVFRWSLDGGGDRLRLEHLRFGADRPVFLFDLVPAAGGGLESAEPHACSADRYAALMGIEEEEVRLSWTITGPAKDSQVSYVYRAADERLW